jgi:hypothetical protein
LLNGKVQRFRKSMINMCPGNPFFLDLHEGGSVPPISFLSPAATQVGSTLLEDVSGGLLLYSFITSVLLVLVLHPSPLG